MTNSKHLLVAGMLVAAVAIAGPASAQSRGGRAVGRAVPRGSGGSVRVVRPQVVTAVPYRPYVYRPSLGFYYGYPYYGAFPYYAYGYPYGYAPYAYGSPAYGYGGAARPYGGIRIKAPDRNAEVYADGYYVGAVDDFDGTFQELTLEVGPHHIEVRPAGLPPIAFDMYVEPGRTITYRAPMQPQRP